jgi:predicted AlkP superfamily phosphohydrolase/phosphomutase
VYFSSIDQNSHMLWGKHMAEVLETYRAVDAAIGEVLDNAAGADIVILSDHGFTTFDRAVNLNSWLGKNGYMTLEGGPGDDEVPFARVDWSKTQAYALGLNGLYLNLAGREKQGIVPQGAESQELLKRIAADLLAFRDNGKTVVESVYAPPRSDGAPDLIVGYARSYRGSWQTALGAAPDLIVEDNKDAWIGDHCINSADVPGVLFSSRKLILDDPRLKDVTVTILHLFGINSSSDMTGRNVM